MALPARPSMRDRVREEAKKSTTEGAGYLNIPKGFKLYQSEDGEDQELDVIPYENDKKNHPRGYEVGELIPYFRFKIHKGIGAEDQKYVCPTSFGKPCPICEEVQRMRRSKDGDKDLIKDLAAKDRFIMQIIDLKDKKNQDIQIWEESYHAFLKKLLADIDAAENSDGSRKRKRAHAGFAELVGGQTLIIDFAEKKGFKNFVEATRIDAEDRDNYNESILDETTNLEDCLKVLSYEQLEAKFLELDVEEQGASRNRDEKGADDKSTGRRGRGESAPEPDTRSSRRRGADPDPDPEPPSRSRRGAAQQDPEPDPPSRRRGAAKEEPAAEQPSSRRRGAAAVDPEPEPETRSGRRRGAAAEPDPEPDPEPAPTRSRRGAAAPASECYVPGGVFGKDCDTHKGDPPEPNCFDCPEETWKRCKALQLKGLSGEDVGQ